LDRTRPQKKSPQKWRMQNPLLNFELKMTTVTDIGGEERGEGEQRQVELLEGTKNPIGDTKTSIAGKA